MPLRQAPSDGWRTPQWDTSRSSAASASAASATTSSRTNSSVSDRNPISVFTRALGACFAPTVTRNPKDTNSEDYSSRTRGQSTSGSSYGNSYGSARKLGKGLGQSPPRMKPGGTSFTMDQIKKATKNFSPLLKIGQGGFGTVYRGVLDDGTVVAVKRAKKSLYDSNLGTEFQSEVTALSQIEHMSLVRFLGYLEHEEERLVIVEYVPNGTLREHLDGLRGSHLDLASRLDIAIDVAHAITYLHMYMDQPIIHRDVKASNILLTENLRVKVADFGFARLGANETGVSHVSTQVKGTAGYLDPEYLRTYQLTVKSDVYSFGVLLVEIVSGRRPIEPKRDLKERITVKWAIRKFTDGHTIQVLDPSLPRNPSTNLALEKVLELSLQCLAPTKEGRPSMKRCAEILWSIRKDYRELLASDPSSQQKSKQSLQ